MVFSTLETIRDSNKVHKQLKDSSFQQGNVKTRDIINFDRDDDVIKIFNQLKINKECIENNKNKKYFDNGTDFKTTFIHAILMAIEPSASLLNCEGINKKLYEMRKDMLDKIELLIIEKKNGPKWEEIRDLLTKNKANEYIYNFMSLYLKRNIVVLDIDLLARYEFGKFSECVWILKREGSYFAIDEDDKTDKCITRLYSKDELIDMNYNTMCKVFKMMFNEKRSTKREMIEKINLIYT